MAMAAAAQKNVSWKKGDSRHHGLSMSPVLDYIGFDLTEVSPTCLAGTFVVSQNTVQPYGVLHGGVSALIAEDLGSMAASIAAGFSRIAGIDLSISHVQAAAIGTRVHVRATPVNVGRRIQVWKITFYAEKRASFEELRKSKVPELQLVAAAKLTATVLPTKSETSSAKQEGLPAKL